MCMVYKHTLILNYLKAVMIAESPVATYKSPIDTALEQTDVMLGVGPVEVRRGKYTKKCKISNLVSTMPNRGIKLDNTPISNLYKLTMEGMITMQLLLAHTAKTKLLL